MLVNPFLSSSLQTSVAKQTLFVASRQFSSQPLFKTEAYDLHVKLGGKMVPFAGFSMPVQYSSLGSIAAHKHTRTAAGLFDVSHMAQLAIKGKDRVEFLERVVVSGIAELAPGHALLSVITNEQGGIIDDTVISNRGGEHYMVINASRVDADLKHLKEQLQIFHKQSKDIQIELLSRHDLLHKNGPDFPASQSENTFALFALQGPEAVNVVSSLVGESSADRLRTQAFMSGALFDIHLKASQTLLSKDTLITRCGYTGEDGFEIRIPSPKATALMETLLSFESVAPIGLGARDSLRLEAGLCLYGHEIDHTTSPIEAQLAWTIPKRRREQGGFIGFDAIKKHLVEGVSRKRIGFVLQSAGVPREDYVILNEEGETIGNVTSGGFSPMLNKGIGMGMIKSNYSKTGTKIILQSQKNPKSRLEASVAKTPIVPTKYYKP